MSQSLISRSPDLLHLQDEGYDLQIHSGHLLVEQIPYVNAHREIRYGILVAPLTLVGDRTTTPSDHVVHFAGDAPCDREGRRLERMINSSQDKDLGDGLVVNHLFSCKPPGGYPDFHAKMTTYIRMISAPALSLDPTLTVTPFPVVAAAEEDSPFAYVDTASSRAGITALTEKFRGSRIAIVGAGGTGSYVLDLVAKTPVAEIHLFDKDIFLQHNAFRCPGAASIDELQSRPSKVDFLAGKYIQLHRRVIPHNYAISLDTAHEMQAMDFVFIAMDDSDAKRDIVTALEDYEIPFIDTGMGLHLDDGVVAGILRVTTSTPGRRNHVHARNRIPFAATDVHDEYAQNIQVVDLNALNAALAVIAWKKHIGFYRDLEREHFTTYTLDGNHLLNEEQGS